MTLQDLFTDTYNNYQIVYKTEKLKVRGVEEYLANEFRCIAEALRQCFFIMVKVEIIIIILYNKYEK